MKFDSAPFVKDQALQSEEMGEIELSSAELEIVMGGSCPGSNGFPFNEYPYQGGPGYNYGGCSGQGGPGYNYGGYPGQGGPGYNYGGCSGQGGPGYNYGGFPNTGDGSGCNQLSPCMVPPTSCSSY